jgi:hypothetical protein
MRLATARDEIEPLRDRSIDGPDDPYLTILVLARVITRLGSLADVGIDEVEGLFAADLAFLQDLYGIINFGDQADVEALQASVLPDESVSSAGDESDSSGSSASADDGDVEADGSEDTDGSEDADVGPGDNLDEEESPVPSRRARVEEVVSTARE